MSRPKLLLADDSMTIQKVVNLTFADHGMEVVTFSDGDSAVDGLYQIKPDIVLADVNMPGLTGYQVCEMMRGDDAFKNTPVVLLVGSFEPFDRDEAERVGANGHLTKPFSSIAELVSTVDGLLASSAPAGSDASEQVQGPDTTDIDILYQQSFVETVEIERGGEFNIEYGDDGIDDEMIQTSYADPDAGAETDEDKFVAEPGDEIESFANDTVDAETDSLIAESLPQGPLGPDAAKPVIAEPKDAGERGVRTEDPFSSRAAEIPAADPASVSSPPTLHQLSAADTESFSFDDADLLEIPRATPVSREFTVSRDSADSKEIVSLSPELIELIVEKVVERLAQKY